MKIKGKSGYRVSAFGDAIDVTAATDILNRVPAEIRGVDEGDMRFPLWAHHLAFYPNDARRLGPRPASSLHFETLIFYLACQDIVPKRDVMMNGTPLPSTVYALWKKSIDVDVDNTIACPSVGDPSKSRRRDHVCSDDYPYDHYRQACGVTCQNWLTGEPRQDIPFITRLLQYRKSVMAGAAPQDFDFEISTSETVAGLYDFKRTLDGIQFAALSDDAITAFLTAPASLRAYLTRVPTFSQIIARPDAVTILNDLSNAATIGVLKEYAHVLAITSELSPLG